MRALFVVAIAITPPMNDWDLAKAGRDLPGEHDLSLVASKLGVMAQQMEQKHEAWERNNPRHRRNQEESDGFRNFVQQSQMQAGRPEPTGAVFIEKGPKEGSLLESDAESPKLKPMTKDQEEAKDIQLFDKVSTDLGKVTNYLEKGGAKFKADADYFAKEVAAQKRYQDERAHPSKYKKRAGGSSLLQQSEEPEDPLSKVEQKLKALQAQIKADSEQFKKDNPVSQAPSSFAEVGAEASEGEKILQQLSQLRALKQHVATTTSMLANGLGLDPPAPSSFAQTVADNLTPDEIMVKIEDLKKRMSEVGAKFLQESAADNAAAHKAEDSSFVERKAEEHMRSGK